MCAYMYFPAGQCLQQDLWLWVNRATNGLCSYLPLQGVVNCGARAAVAPPAAREGKEEGSRMLYQPVGSHL